jgi:2-succinyl-6-hydroxy-2,4-cyclohexadiene-1-carboxylate synthase
MGGRICLQLALDHPDLVERLVLVSASPGISDPSARDERRRADDDLAARVERRGVDAFLDEWLAQPMFATLPATVADVDARRANSVERLTHQLRVLGQGAQPSNWERLTEIEVPTLLFVGESDRKYVAIAEQMADAMRGGVRTMPRRGHACHLEDPGSFWSLLRSWLPG